MLSAEVIAAGSGPAPPLPVVPTTAITNSTATVTVGSVTTVSGPSNSTATAPVPAAAPLPGTIDNSEMSLRYPALFGLSQTAAKFFLGPWLGGKADRCPHRMRVVSYGIGA